MISCHTKSLWLITYAIWVKILLKAHRICRICPRQLFLAFMCPCHMTLKYNAVIRRICSLLQNKNFTIISHVEWYTIFLAPGPINTMYGSDWDPFFWANTLSISSIDGGSGYGVKSAFIYSFLLSVDLLVFEVRGSFLKELNLI